MSSTLNIDITSQAGSLPNPRLLPHVVSDTAKNTPSKIWASIPLDATDASKGYEDITFARLAYGVDRAALWLQRYLHPGPKKENEFESLAYMGPPDSRYMILTLAAIKAGFQILFLSPRNSDEAQYAVMTEARCSKILCALSMKDRVTSFMASWPAIDNLENAVFVVPEQEEFLKDTPVAPVPYLKTFKTARFDPLVSLHTSSTTGLPKLVRLNQGYGFHEDVVRFYPKVGRLDVLTRSPFYGHCRLYLAFPLFHAGGILLGILKALYQDIILVFQPPLAPLSGTLVNAILRHGRCDGCVIPPYLVEQMISTPSHLDTLRNLKFVQFGSGPMSKSTGDTLISQQPSCPHYIGTTEIGLLPLLELDDRVQNWQYFHFHPWSGVEMRRVSPEESLFELVVVRLPVSSPGLQPIFELFPDLHEWPTRDLYSPHPTKPDLWRPCGRADDIVVLSNGEKFNPVDMESRITGCHSAITGALVVGQGRFQPGLLLEVTGLELPDEAAKTKLLDEVWPFVISANESAPKHGQLTRPLVLFSSPDKPFLRTPKFSVRRQPTISMYASQIDEMFSAVEDNNTGLTNDDVPPDVDLSSPDFTHSFLQQLIPRVTAWSYKVDPEMDLFILGMDSLHVVRIVRAIRFAWPDPSSLDFIDAKIVYSNPTIASLAAALSTILHTQRLPSGENTLTNGSGQDSVLAREARIQDTISRWCENFHQVTGETKNTSRSRESPWTIILTGSTGSLGTFLLRTLVVHPRVVKIICLNRSASAAQQWEKQNPPEYQQQTQCDVAFLQTTNIGAPFFGLPEQTYHALCEEVTHVIHNAWPVNFNLSLESFENIHIAGIRRFIDFSAQSTKCVRICYVSSLSAVRSVDGLVPEEVVSNMSAPARMGYGESKFVAESILAAASASSKGQVPSTIFRIGQIAGPIGPSRTAWNAQEWFPSILTSSKSLGVLPATFGGMEGLNWIPVDILAKTIVEIIESEEDGVLEPQADDVQYTQVYHLINPATTTWNQGALPVVQQILGIDTVVPLEEWITQVDAGPEPDDLERPNPARKILRFYQSLLGSGSQYACVKAAEQSPTLKHLGPVRADWVLKWLEDLKLGVMRN